MKFVKNGTHLVAVDRIEWADYSRIEELRLVVGFDDQVIQIEGIDALESAMAMRPSCLEGKRLRWARRTWMLHNLVGHPLMQLLAMLGRHDLAFKVHDATVPAPLGGK